MTSDLENPSAMQGSSWPTCFHLFSSEIPKFNSHEFSVQTQATSMLIASCRATDFETTNHETIWTLVNDAPGQPWISEKSSLNRSSGQIELARFKMGLWGYNYSLQSKGIINQLQNGGTTLLVLQFSEHVLHLLLSFQTLILLTPNMAPAIVWLYCAFGYKMSPQTSTNDFAAPVTHPFSQPPKPAMSSAVLWSIVKDTAMSMQMRQLAPGQSIAAPGYLSEDQGFIDSSTVNQQRNHRKTIETPSTNNRDTYIIIHQYIYIQYTVYTINIHQIYQYCKITVTFENHDDSTCTCVVVSLQASHPPLSLESDGVSEFQRPQWTTLSDMSWFSMDIPSIFRENSMENS